MPAEGAVFRPRAELLTFEEITRVVQVAVEQCEVGKVRVTGGEPLVRAELPKLITMLREVEPTLDIGLTTNAVLLDKQAVALKEAGVSQLNISLDALDPDVFEEMTRRNDFDRVMAGIAEARRVGFGSIKLNAVSVRGLTESQIIPFGEFARESGLEVRFIEYMPLDADAAWEREKVLFGQEIIEQLTSHFGTIEPAPSRGPAPAQQYRFRDGRGTIGVIPSVSEPFCDHCNRFRLTSDGKLRACLFSLAETDVRTILRETPASESQSIDDRVEQAIRDCVASKWSGHRINLETFEQPARPMYAIGG